MDQMLGTALLLLIISAVTDSRNMKVNSSLVPLLIGLGLTAIHIRSVPLTFSTLNGPRNMTVNSSLVPLLFGLRLTVIHIRSVSSN